MPIQTLPASWQVWHPPVMPVWIWAVFGAGVGGFLVWSWNNAAPTTNNWPVGPGDPTVQVIDSH